MAFLDILKKKNSTKGSSSTQDNSASEQPQLPPPIPTEPAPQPTPPPLPSSSPTLSPTPVESKKVPPPHIDPKPSDEAKAMISDEIAQLEQQKASQPASLAKPDPLPHPPQSSPAPRPKPELQSAPAAVRPDPQPLPVAKPNQEPIAWDQDDDLTPVPSSEPAAPDFSSLPDFEEQRKKPSQQLPSFSSVTSPKATPVSPLSGQGKMEALYLERSKYGDLLDSLALTKQELEGKLAKEAQIRKLDEKSAKTFTKANEKLEALQKQLTIIDEKINQNS